MIRGAIVIIVIFLFFPVCIGELLEIRKMIDKYLVGFASEQAMFLPVYGIGYALNLSLSTTWNIYILLISILSIMGIVYSGIFEKRKKKNRFIESDSYTSLVALLKNFYFIMAVLFISLQVIRNIVGEPNIYGDDSFYISYVAKMADENSFASSLFRNDSLSYALTYKYILTSYYKWLAGLSIFSGIHPLILCKTVLAVIYLIVQYLVVWRIGSFLFEKSPQKLIKQSIFILFYAVLVEWGLISYYTISRRAMMWIWNSKSLCFCIFLPLLALYLYMILNDKTESEYILKHNSLFKNMIILTLIVIACDSATMMGVMMSSIIIFIYVLIAFFKYKKIRCVVPIIPSMIYNVLLVMIIYLNQINIIELV